MTTDLLDEQPSQLPSSIVPPPIIRAATLWMFVALGITYFPLEATPMEWRNVCSGVHFTLMSIVATTAVLFGAGVLAETVKQKSALLWGYLLAHGLGWYLFWQSLMTQFEQGFASSRVWLIGSLVLIVVEFQRRYQPTYTFWTMAQIWVVGYMLVSLLMDGLLVAGSPSFVHWLLWWTIVYNVPLLWALVRLRWRGADHSMWYAWAVRCLILGWMGWSLAQSVQWQVFLVVMTGATAVWKQGVDFWLERQTELSWCIWGLYVLGVVLLMRLRFLRLAPFDYPD